MKLWTENLTKFPTTLILMVATLFITGLFVGCQPNEDDSESTDNVVVTQPDPLKMLFIGNDTEVSESIKRHWAAQRDGELDVKTITTEAFVDSELAIDEGIDVLVMSPGLLGQLEAQNKLLEIPKWLLDSEELNRSEFLSHHRRILIRHDNKSWAIPLGAPQMVIVSNKSTFVSLNLAVPETWEDFNQVSRVLAKTEDLQTDEGEPLPTSIEFPLAEGWAVQSFLARVAPMIRNRGKLSTVFERRTMEPLINTPPFVKALEELKVLADEFPGQIDLTPADIFERLLEGETAVGITWPCARSAADLDISSNKADLQIARLPRADQYFDFQEGKWSVRTQGESSQIELLGFSGMVAVVAESSRNTRQAFEFLEWLGSKSVNLITVAGSDNTGPFRASHLGDPARWTGQQIPDEVSMQYADAIQEINENDVVFVFPRIPGRQRYLEELDDAVRKCLRGNMTPEDALNRVAENWNAITDELGRKFQVSELRNDAGL